MYSYYFDGTFHVSSQGHPAMARTNCPVDVEFAGRFRAVDGMIEALPTSGYMPNTRKQDKPLAEYLILEWCQSNGVSAVGLRWRK